MENNESEIINIIKELKCLEYTDSQILNDFEIKILKLKNVELSAYFYKNIKGANLELHEKVIIDSKDLLENYIFARDIKGADIKAHGQVIINSDNIEYNEKFRNLKGADVDAHNFAIKNIKIQQYRESLNKRLDYMIQEKVKIKK